MICAQLRRKTRSSISRKICSVKSGFQILYAEEQLSSPFSKDNILTLAHRWNRSEGKIQQLCVSLTNNLQTIQSKINSFFSINASDTSKWHPVLGLQPRDKAAMSGSIQ